MENKKVAELFYKIGDLLDIKGESYFKSRAYRMAAQRIEVLDEDINSMVKEDRLRSIPGIGRALAEKIKEFVLTGELKYFEELKKEIPVALLKLLEVPGLGPKKVSVIYRELDVKDIDGLREACKNGRIRDLEGFGEITERNILRGIKLLEKTQGRILLNVAYRDGMQIKRYLENFDKVVRIDVAGSLRRMKETIGDIDILVSSDYPEDVMDYFVDFDDVKRVLLKGKTKTSVLLNNDSQVDLRVVENKSFGSALQYFTGSKEHNVTMRGIAIKKGLKLNEYGLFDKNTDEYIKGKEEKEIYNELGLEYIPPELRENRGEVERAKEKKLPKLIGYDDVKGDFHVHSNWSDGSETMEDLADYAKKMGYSFLGIADHSKSLKIANGLSEERLLKKIDRIKELNKKIAGLTLLCGTECDINADGSLDYSDKILEKLDYVAVGIHKKFKMSKKQMTERVVEALKNEYATFLSHPTCRLIGRREPLPLEMETIFDTAVETNTYLEINAFPDRLDLNDSHIRQAREKNVGLVLGTDAHALNHLSFMQFGVATARRGWAEKKDVLNTMDIEDILKKL
ncbi:MAG: DNA polymerase/3'-5' exonuclease PolX [Candidatus Thermoplasmatota archaeon]